MVKEANAISVELKKNVTFQFTILTDSPYSPLPFSIATGTDVDIDAGDVRLTHALESSERGLGLERGPVVAVAVKDSKHGATNIWSMSKFRYGNIDTILNLIEYMKENNFDFEKCVVLW